MSDRSLGVRPTRTHRWEVSVKREEQSLPLEQRCALALVLEPLYQPHADVRYHSLDG